MQPFQESNIPDVFSDTDSSIQTPPPPPQLPPKINVRQALIEKVPLGNFLLGPEAMRGYGTMAGAAVGGTLGAGAAGLGAIPGAAFGGYVGNRLVNEAQSWFPGVLGEPSQDGKSTAAIDSASNMLGAGVAKVAPKLFFKSGRQDLLAKVANKFIGTKPEDQLTTYAINPNFQTSLRPSISELQKAGMPMTIGQIKGSPLALEMEKTASGHSDIVKAQGQYIRNMAKNLMDNSTLNLSSKGKTDIYNWGMGNTAEWLAKTTPKVAMELSQHTDPEKWLANKLGTIYQYKDFTRLVGADKAHTVLFKDALENSTNTDGIFDPIALYNYFRKNKDSFNYIAKQMEKEGVGKASEMKASWNRFIYANLIAHRGKQVSEKALELQATNGLLTAGISLPILGLGSYPAMRSLAVGGKLTLIGPAIGKAFSDPKVVDKMMQLSTNAKNNPSNVNAFKTIAKWAWKNGVPFTAMNGENIMINPRDLTPVTPAQFEIMNRDTIPDVFAEPKKATEPPQ